METFDTREFGIHAGSRSAGPIGRTNLEQSDLFSRAVALLVDAVEGTVLERKPTPISKFKASYNEVLQGANHGRAQVITQGRKQYLLLSQEQVIALAQHNVRSHSMGDIARSIDGPSRPLRATNVHLARTKAQQFSLPDLHVSE